MSHSTKPTFLKRSMTVLAVVGTAVASIFYIQAFAKIDPLMNMGKHNSVSPDQLGISLGNVHLVQYRGNQKVAEAKVAKVFIPSDRSQYHLTTVSEGTLFAEKGKKLHFSAPKVLWNASRRIMTADESARVWNADIDLKTKLVRINERDQSIYVPGKIQGKLYTGKLTANNFRYDIATEYTNVGPGEWDGNLALSLQDEGQAARKKWKFTFTSADAIGNTVNGITTVTHAMATDFEIYVKADKFVHEQKTDVLTATGHVQYFSPKANLACEQAVIYRKERRAILTGNVDMLVKPKDKQTKAEVVEIPPFRPVVPMEVAEDRPGAPPVQRDPKQNQLDDDVQNAKTLKNYPTAITAARIEYWYGKGSRRAIITGAPQARQDLPEGRWRHLWAHEAYYDGEAELLTLKSRPSQADARAQTSLGDNLVAETVVVSTKEDDEEIHAKGMKEWTVFGKTNSDDGVGPKPPDPIKPTKGGGGGGLQGPIGGGKRPPKK